MLTAADLAPVRSALAAAHRRGTTAFDATGDMAGLECRGGKRWSDPPTPDDVGVDAVGSLPEMTAVGGTTLSTDAQGRWLAEQAWYDVPLTPGHRRRGVGAVRPTRLAERHVQRRPLRQTTGARCLRGRRPVHRRQIRLPPRGRRRRGTSQAAPIWAGIAAIVNQILREQNMDPLGDFNPLLYQVSWGLGDARLPRYRPGRQRDKSRRYRIRHGDRAGQPQCRQPGQEHPAHPLGGAMIRPARGRRNPSRGYAVPPGRYLTQRVGGPNTF